MTDELSPDDEELLTELLLHWEDSQRTPSPKSPEEICGERFDLVDEVKRRIKMLETMNRLMIDPAAVTGAVNVGSYGTGSLPGYPVVPGFEILGEVGRGGMGIVYKAVQLNLRRRPVALKVINSWGRDAADLGKRLRREADALGSLNHDHVIRVYDIIDRSPIICLVLEFVDGQSLEKREKISAFDPRSAAEISLTVAKTMSDVHRAGLLHRDLKPANLLRDQNGAVKIGDFGIAKHFADPASNTATGNWHGTPSYMAPEQSLGVAAKIGEWTDVYGIGATLYDLLTGRPPFMGATVQATLEQVDGDDPVAPRMLVPQIPVDLETICLKCLSKEPEKRYATAAALASDLQNFLDGKPIIARPVGPFGRGWRWAKRNPDRAGWVASIVLGFMAAVGLGAWELSRIHDAAAVLAASQEKIRVQDFYRSLGEISERSRSTPTGWSWNNLKELDGMVALRPKDDQDAISQLRREFVKALTAFDARKQRELLHGFDPYVIEFTPDGSRLIAGANADVEGIVNLAIIDTPTWNVAHTLSFPADPEWAKDRPDGVRSLLFTPDGKELFVGCRSGWIRVFDMQSKTEVRQWRGHSHYVYRLRFNRSHNAILSCSKDKTVKKWSVTGQKLAEIMHSCELTDLIVLSESLANFNVSEDKVAVAGEHPLWLRESDFQRLDEDGLERNLTGGGSNVLARYPDGGGWIRDTESTFEVMNLGRRSVSRSFIDRNNKFVPHAEMHGMEISPEGRWLVTTTGASAKLWDLAAHDRVVELPSGGRGRVVGRFHPTRDLLVVTGDTKLTVYELSPQKIWQGRLQQSEYVVHAAISPVGERNTASRLYGFNHQLLHYLNSHPIISGEHLFHQGRNFNFSPNGDCYYFVEIDEHSNNFLVAQKKDQSRPFSTVDRDCRDAEIVKITPDGRSLYFTAKAKNSLPEMNDRYPGVLRVLDVDTLQFHSIFTNSESERTLRASKFESLVVGGSYLCCSSADRQIRILDLKSEEVLATLQLDTICDTLALPHPSYGDSYVVAGTRQGDLLVIDVPSGQIRQTIHAHKDAVTAVTSSGMDLFISGSRDGKVKFWKLNDGELSSVLEFGPLSGPVMELDSNVHGGEVAILVEGETCVRHLRVSMIRDKLAEYGLDW